MAFEAARDSRRAALALALAGLLLAGALALAAVRGLGSEWRAHQAAYLALGLARDQAELGPRQALNCAGEVERCGSCHLGIQRGAPDPGARPAPFGAHPAGWLEGHPPQVGCTDCHGGVGRALTAAVAHGLPDGSERDPQLTGLHQRARCARCHVPGAAVGMPRVAAGAGLYLELGCSLCHPLSEGGLGGYDYGPDLRSLGRRGLGDLRASLIDPSANFADSTMPSFRAAFEGSPEAAAALDDLLAFLQSQSLPRGGPCDRTGRSLDWVAAPCARCHAGSGGRAGGRFQHRCDYLRSRSAELGCAGCHPGEVPAAGPAGGFCPLVSAHREACAACHPGAPRTGAGNGSGAGRPMEEAR